MKKITQKLSLFILACIIFAQASVPVRAEDEQLGRITIHRFAGTTSEYPTEGTPLNGIPYRVERVRLISGTPQTAENLRNPANFEPMTGADEFYQEAITLMGIANFPYLPRGLYLVTELPHTITPESDRVAPFIVGIPRRGVGEDADEWIYDVDVFPKSDEDTPVVFEKELELIWDEDLGELVAEWSLTSTIPRLIGNATRFEFIDPLLDSLTFIPNSVVGTYYRMEGTGESATQVRATLLANTFEADVDGDNDLSIALTTEGFSHLSANALLAPDGTLTFTFRTRLATDEDDLGPITNTARLYYNEEEGQYTETPPPVEYHFALEIEKIDVNGDRVGEATFELFFDEARTQPVFPVDGVNTSFTTTNGLVYIPFLQEGVIYIEETEAPAGFRPNTGMMRVVIDEDVTTSERRFVVELQIVNEVEGGFVLPETGGVGTVIFTAVGLALIGGAVSLAYVAKNRRRSHD